jgi:hypothetical protein
MSHIIRDPSFVPQNCNTTILNDTHVGVRSCPRWFVTRPDQSTIWHHPLPIASSDGFPRCEYTSGDGISNMKIRRPDLRNCSLVMRFPTHLCNHPPQCRMRCRRRRICRRHSPHRLTRSLHLIKILSCQSKTFGVYCLLLLFFIIILRVIINSWVKVIMNI